MAYQVEVGPRADAQLSQLDASIGSAVERKIMWLAENAAVMIHRRLVGMPDDLVGLCKLRVGDWRILYWIYHEQKIVRIYRKCIAICKEEPGCSDRTVSELMNQRFKSFSDLVSQRINDSAHSLTHSINRSLNRSFAK